LGSKHVDDIKIKKITTVLIWKVYISLVCVV